MYEKEIQLEHYEYMSPSIEEVKEQLVKEFGEKIKFNDLQACLMYHDDEEY